MAEHILKDTHNPKLNILECDRTTPLNRISSRDSQGLVTKRRDRAKGLHQIEIKITEWVLRNKKVLDLGLLHMLSIGSNRGR